MRNELEATQCASYLKALAAPERLRIIQCLRERPKNVTEISAELERPLVNVSHHLGILRRAGLIRPERHGKNITYSLEPTHFPAGGAGPDCVELGCCRLDLNERA